MKTDLQSLLMLGAGSAFFIYLLAKMLVPRIGGDESLRAAHQRIGAAKRKAADRGATPAARAAALREAAMIALQELKRPELAASYALRAERLYPADVEGIGLLSAALRQGTKYRALERILWRQLAAAARGSAGYERSFEELVGLYDGPLQRPEAAKVLRELKSAARA
jgi:hypothetical protein